MFSCNLPPALLAEWPGSFMCYCVNMGGTDTEIRVSTESWPWRRKFSCRSCRASNQRPFNHKSSTLTTELLPLQWWRSYIPPPPPLLLPGRKMDHTIPEKPTLWSVNQIINCNYLFATITSVFCFLHFIFHHYNVRWNQVHSMAVLWKTTYVSEGSKYISNCHKNSN